MGVDTNILVSGAITIRQLYNALERIQVKPIFEYTAIEQSLRKQPIGSSFVPIEVDGLSRNLFITFIDNEYFKFDQIRELPQRSRKLKNSKGPVLRISLGYDELAVKLLTRLAYELGGGYLKEKDTATDGRENYKELKGKK